MKFDMRRNANYFIMFIGIVIIFLQKLSTEDT